MEFFEQIWAWISTNYKGVLTFLTSSGLISGIGSLLLVLRNKKETKENTLETKKLSTLLNENKELNERVKTLENKCNDLVDASDKQMIKLNAMLEVMSLVYNSLRDENTRKTVQAVLTNAKYNETATRASLLEKVRALEKDGKDRQEQVEKTAEEIKKTLAVTEKSVVVRG